METVDYVCIGLSLFFVILISLVVYIHIRDSNFCESKEYDATCDASVPSGYIACGRIIITEDNLEEWKCVGVKKE